LKMCGDGLLYGLDILNVLNKVVVGLDRYFKSHKGKLGRTIAGPALIMIVLNHINYLLPVHFGCGACGFLISNNRSDLQL
jgi:hypothetical protein